MVIKEKRRVPQRVKRGGGVFTGRLGGGDEDLGGSRERDREGTVLMGNVPISRQRAKGMKGKQRGSGKDYGPGRHNLLRGVSFTCTKGKISGGERARLAYIKAAAVTCTKSFSGCEI